MKNEVSEKYPEFDYQAYYCEENIWRLIQHPFFTDKTCRVVFISNHGKTCAMWHMRAAEPQAYVIWDYHVILLTFDGAWKVWDLDTMLGYEIPLVKYLSLSFRPVPVAFKPLFRVVPTDVFLSHFSSDRSHMHTHNGSWQAEPPSWPAPIKGIPNLMRWVDMKDNWLGQIMDISGLMHLLPD